MTVTRRTFRAIILLALTLLIFTTIACTTSPQPTPDYPDTVDAARTTMESPTMGLTTMVLPTPAPNTTATLPSPPRPTYTPWPRPTYTPWPQPTYTPRPTQARSTPDERPPAPLFQATTLDGSEFILADAIGKPTLIAFWAPW